MAKKLRYDQIEGLPNPNSMFTHSSFFAKMVATVSTLDAELPLGGFIGSYSSSAWGGSDRPIGASYGGYLKFRGYSSDVNNLDFYFNNGHASVGRLWFRTKNSAGLTSWKELWHSENFNPVNYALKDGTNASGSWANTAHGLTWHNPTIQGKTLNGAGATVDLKTAIQGYAAGIINTPGIADGNPDSNWYHRIKMLHPNSSGYFTEIAVQMTGGASLQYKRMDGGTDSGWIKVFDNQNFNPGNYATISGVNSQLSAYATLAGTQTFTGQNSFSVLPLVSGTPTLTNHVINLGWIQSQNFHQQNLNIDVSEENGELRINPAEVLLEPQTGQSEFDGRDYYHRLVYVNIIESGTINLKNLQSRQRLVLFNNSDNSVEVDEDGITMGTLKVGEKISVYKEESTSYDYAIYYDKSACAIGTF